MDLDEKPVSQRRRGEELEDALLEAAWDELEQGGYAAFTFEAVAKRAQTSRPVLYRRWPTRSELVLAAVGHHFDRDVIDVPDTGSLRDDLYAWLRVASARRSGLAVLVGVQFAGLYEETGSNFSTVRERLLGTRDTWQDVILARADARGEIDLASVPEAIRSLPFTLLRHELLMTLAPASEEFIAEVVDVIFMPLIQRYTPAGGAAGASPQRD